NECGKHVTWHVPSLSGEVLQYRNARNVACSLHHAKGSGSALLATGGDRSKHRLHLWALRCIGREAHEPVEAVRHDVRAIEMLIRQRGLVIRVCESRSRG